MGGYFESAAGFLIRALFDLYILLVMLRFLLQLFHADFYNPLSQFLVRITRPLLQPQQRFIASYRNINVPALLLLFALKFVQLGILLLLTGIAIIPLGIAIYAIAELLELALNVFLVAILIRVALNWLSPNATHLLIGLLYSLTDPLLAPARRLIAPIGGIDLSPLAVIIGLQLASILLVAPITDFARYLM